MTEIYRKNNLVTSETQANTLLDALADFYENPEPGKPFPLADPDLIRIYNGGEPLEWEWSEENQQEYEQRTASEQAEADQLAFYQDPDNLEAWKDAKVRPWRNMVLVGWVDCTFTKGMLYQLTIEEETERANTYQALLDWPDTFTEWVDDAAIEAVKPSMPSYIV